MGVPRLFRWLVERYPLLLRSSEATPQPVIGTYQMQLINQDNLYLDFNGIVHKCSHSDEETSSVERSEKEIMFAVFGCIERIFGVVKPKKLLYIAVDGKKLFSSDCLPFMNTLRSNFCRSEKNSISL